MPIMDYGLPAPELSQGNGRFWGAIDKLAQTWPAKMAQSAYDAVRLPGQVAGGIMSAQPAQPGIMWSDMDEARQQATQGTMMNRAADLGGLVMGGGYPMAQTGALGMAGGKLSKPQGYPIAPKSEWYGDANFEMTGGRIVNMTPDEFLQKSRPLAIDDASRENIDILKQHITDGKTLDPLAIYKNGKEDGRHRANAAKELGIESVPVIIWDSNF
jgi:hypothetical protein